MIKVDSGIVDLMIGKKKYRILTKIGMKDAHVLKRLGEKAKDEKQQEAVAEEIVAVVKGLIVKGMASTRKWWEKSVSVESIDLSETQAIEIINQIVAMMGKNG